MKKLIKKWLGIDETSSVKNALTEEQIKEYVRDTILEIFNDKSPVRCSSNWVRYHEYLSETISRSFKTESDKHIREKVAQRVGSEEFLDDIVKRLKNKQLN